MKASFYLCTGSWGMGMGMGNVEYGAVGRDDTIRPRARGFHSPSLSLSRTGRDLWFIDCWLLVVVGGIGVERCMKKRRAPSVLSAV